MILRLRPPPLWTTLCLTAACYALLWPLVIPDVSQLMIPWLQQVEGGGLWGGLSRPVGNYPPAYAYLLDVAGQLRGVVSSLGLIKSIAVLSVACMAAAAGSLLRALKTADPYRWGALVLLLPSAATNGALIGQCDGFWVAPCLMAIGAAVRRAPVSMLIWYGLAFAFKSQAIFLAPFVVCRLIDLRTPVRHWIVAPAAAVATLVPAIAAGWPVDSLAGLYFGQVRQFPQLSFNAPNIWAVYMAFVPDIDTTTKMLIVGLSLTIVAGLMAAFLSAWKRADPRSLVDQALLFALVTVGTLPLMHERYFLLADVLALIAAIAAPSRRTITRCAMVQIGSIGGIMAFLSGIGGLAAIGAVPMVLATLSVLRSLADEGPAATSRAAPRWRLRRL